MSIRRISSLNQTKEMLQEVLNEWLVSDAIPEVDWKSRMKALEFQEMLRERDALIARLPSYTCKQCPDFEEHVRTPLRCIKRLHIYT